MIKAKNYGLWTSLAGLVYLALEAFGVKIDNALIDKIASIVSGILVTLGIISNPSFGKWYTDKIDKTVQTIADKAKTTDKNIDNVINIVSSEHEKIDT